jgi:hypothetical protein
MRLPRGGRYDKTYHSARPACWLLAAVPRNERVSNRFRFAHDLRLPYSATHDRIFRMLMVPRDDAQSRAAWLAELRATLTLAWPLVLTNLAQIALTTTDVIVLGRLGVEALAAGALGANLYFAVLIFAIGLVTATAPMMARTFGRRLHVVRDVRRTFRQGLWTCVMIAAPSWLLLWNARAILLVLDQEPPLAAAAQEFVHGLQWGLLPFLGFVVLRSFVSALERPLWALIVTAAAVLFNIGANWVLVFGHLGFPALGLRGSGIATSLSNTVLFLGLALIVARHRRFHRYHLFGNWWRPDWKRLRELWRLGVPIGATFAFEVTISTRPCSSWANSEPRRSPRIQSRCRSPRRLSWCRWAWGRRPPCASAARSARVTRPRSPARAGPPLPSG